MHWALVLAAAVGLTLGSFAVGLLASGVLWLVGNRLGHPAWGPPLAVLLVPLALLLPTSPFLDMSVVFTVTCSAAAWAASRSGRTDGAG